MKFSYEWNDQLLASACHELEIVRIKEHYWRKERQKASLVALVLFPLLAALVAGSFPYLTRAQVSGIGSVLIVGVLGGLLGGVLVCLRRLATRVRRRIGPPTWVDWKVSTMLLLPLALGALTGAGGALAVSRYGTDGPYKPQTLYLVALATVLAFARLGGGTIVGSSIGRPR